MNPDNMIILEIRPIAAKYTVTSINGKAHTPHAKLYSMAELARLSASYIDSGWDTLEVWLEK